MNIKGEGFWNFWTVIGCVIVGIVLINIFIVAPQNERKQHYDTINQEYQKYLDTYETDTNEMNALMGQYNLKSISVDERISIVNEYISYYNLRLNHLQDHYNFVIQNEQDLQTIGYNTYGEKKVIRDAQATLKNNIMSMKQDTQEILAYQEQLRALQQKTSISTSQSDQYVQILATLAKILI